MERGIKESDWKLFREIHPIALERFGERALAELQYLMTDKSKPAIERFWEMEGAARERAKDLRMFFDDIRRSNALLQLTAMRCRKLITDEEMARFSPEIRERVAEMLRTN